MSGLIEIVLCELCGRKTELHAGEREILRTNPRLTVCCPVCVEAQKRDPMFGARKKFRANSERPSVRTYA
jgi:hypothetical protein